MERMNAQGGRGGDGLSRRGFLRLAVGTLAGAGAMLALQGCGSEATGGTSASSGASSSASSATGTAASSGGTQAASGSAGRAIKIVVMNQNKPFCYLDADGTTITGYDVESLKLCEQKLGGKYTFSFDAMDFNTMISSLQTGSCDMVSCCLVPNDDRRAKFLFPDEPYLLTPMEFIVAKGSGLKTIEDMAGKTIVTSPVTYEYGMLQAYNEEHPDKAFKLDARDMASGADYIRMVANGQADGYLAYEAGFEDLAKAADVQVDHTDVVLTESCYYMVSQKNQELADDLAKALKEAKSDGSLGELSKKWFNGDDVFEKYKDVLTDNQLMANRASSARDKGKASSASASASAAHTAD